MENRATVLFTRDLSAEGLLKAYDRIGGNLKGKVGIKLHTGEPHGPNIIPRPWVENLIKTRLNDASIVRQTPITTAIDTPPLNIERHSK